jgi:UDP-N-acetylglucosamine 2-epimerase (non-hydrolysing)
MLCVDVRIALDVMRSRQQLSDLTARLVGELGGAMREQRPDLVVVQGDTTTALAGALAAFYEKIPVAHVEAGLRTGVIDNPFPEELNRSLIGRIARWHFAPTPAAARHLTDEGVPEEQVFTTGNTVIDNLLWVLTEGTGASAYRTPARACPADQLQGGKGADSSRSRGGRRGAMGASAVRAESSVAERDVDAAEARARARDAGLIRRAGPKRILVTLHRRENQGERMRGMGRALARLARRGDVEIVLPLHKSPAVRDVLLPELDDHEGILLVEPLGYLDFAATLAECDLVLTDSGGIQEEAPSLGKPSLVLRTTTERPEAVEAGAARLIGTDPEAIVTWAEKLLDDPVEYRGMAGAGNPFGDGTAAHRILAQLAEDFAADVPVGLTASGPYSTA